MIAIIQILKRILLQILVSVALLNTSSVAIGDTKCTIPKSATITPPKTAEGPVKIALGIYLIDIVDLDEIKESFKVDYTVDATWRDPRLSKDTNGYSLSDCRLSIDDIWDPNIRIVNARDPTYRYFERLFIDDDGKVTYNLRLQTNFSSSFDLHEFPFDKQNLTMRFASFDYGPKDVVFDVDGVPTGHLEGIESSGWLLLSNFSDPHTPVLKTGNEQFTQLFHHIIIERKAGYYIWKFVVPLCFIILMASSVFWLDPETFGPQIGISTASVFTLVAFLLGLRQGLPQVAYLTRMDELVLGATILVFASFGEVAYVSRLVYKQRQDLARRIDAYSRWIYLVSFILLLCIILVWPFMNR